MPKVQPEKKFLVERGAKIRNRHTNETGVVIVRADSESGNWYHMATLGGMSLGWWHETDIDSAPKSTPPQTKR